MKTLSPTKVTLISTVLVAVLLVGWWTRRHWEIWPRSEVGAQATLAELEGADPLKDADAAVVRRDYRLVGLSMFSPVVPGSAELQQAYVEGRCDARLIPFTSDDITDETVDRLTIVAAAYGEKYNRRLLERLGFDTLCRPSK